MPFMLFASSQGTRQLGGSGYQKFLQRKYGAHLDEAMRRVFLPLFITDTQVFCALYLHAEPHCCCRMVQEDDAAMLEQ